MQRYGVVVGEGTIVEVGRIGVVVGALATWTVDGGVADKMIGTELGADAPGRVGMFAGVR